MKIYKIQHLKKVLIMQEKTDKLDSEIETQNIKTVLWWFQKYL